MEYAIYLGSLNAKLADKILSKNKKISRLYFGQEFCEELIPDSSEVRKSIEYAAKRKLDYTYISGCLSQRAFKKQYEIFDYLNKQGVKSERIEVVVNDWGALRVISKEFVNLNLLLGRLMTKLQRMPRYTKKEPISFSQLITNPKLWDNQLKVLRSTNLSVGEYRKFLKNQGIKRVELDLVPQGLKVDKSWGFKFSIYTPYSYVTGARTCDLAGLTQPKRAKFITDGPCLKPCGKFFIEFETGQEALPLAQKGNSIFFDNTTIAGEFIKQGVADRVVLQIL